MSYENKTTLFIFLDESGDLTFSPSGTKYWSLTALCTFNPTLGREAFVDLKYKLADEGNCIEYFHATEDKQTVRDQVFARIQQLQDIEVHCVLAEKSKANPVLYQKKVFKNGKVNIRKDESPFYDRVCRLLLKFIFRKGRFASAERIIVVLSSIWTSERHNVIKKALKSYLKNETNIPFEIYFHANRSDINCQIADYCGWAITVAWERAERRPLELIRRQVYSQFDIFRAGDTAYYRK